MNIKQAIKKKAAELGFNMVGVVDAEPAGGLDAYLNWIEQGYHGKMGYLARPDRIIRRQDLQQILPGVRSMLVVGLDYGGGKAPENLVTDPSRGRISNYAWGIDYHELMVPRLKELADWLTGMVKEEESVASKVYVDTGAILERSHGVGAGLGFTGKNTMLISPQRGSYFFLGEILTTVILEPDPPIRMPSCGKCQRCLVGCPTDAFVAPYLLDARKCISYLTIELKGVIPEEMRSMMGNWVYGCDICQEVCPFNRFAEGEVTSVLQPRDWDFIAPPLERLLELDEEQFKRRFEGSPIKRIKRERLVRNAAVAAGNWGDRSLLPILKQLQADPSDLIQEHVTWAINRIEGN